MEVFNYTCTELEKHERNYRSYYRIFNTTSSEYILDNEGNDKYQEFEDWVPVPCDKNCINHASYTVDQPANL